MRWGFLLSIFVFAPLSYGQEPQLYFLHKKYESRVSLVELPNMTASDWRVCMKMKQQFVKDLKNRHEVIVEGRPVTVQNTFKILEINCDNIRGGDPTVHVLFQEREFTGTIEVQAVSHEHVTDFVRADSLAEVHRGDNGLWRTLSEGKIPERLDLDHYQLSNELLLNEEGAAVVGTLLQTAPDFKLRLFDRNKSQYLDLSPMDLMPSPELIMDAMDPMSPHCSTLLR